MKNLIISCVFFILISNMGMPVFGQQKSITLQDAIRMAVAESPEARNAEHTYRSAFWNYRYYRANYLPAMTLTSNPTLNRSISRITMDDGSERFMERNLLTTDLALHITQNISLTGGTLFMETSAERMDLLGDKTHSWQTMPVVVGYRQSLFGYNSLKWDRKIEPVRFREARRRYVEAVELIAAQTTHFFFRQATAQSNLETAQFNYNNADTLYRYAKGRYDIGTITESDMLQLELNKLTEETNLMNARIELENARQELRSFLGIKDETVVDVEVNTEVPEFTIPMARALQYANANSPDKLNMTRRRLESESRVAQAKAEAGLKADIYLRFGLTQTAEHFKEAYRDPLDQQYVSLTLALPILDWGRGKGRVRVARSNRELVLTQLDQEQVDFDQNVRKLVDQFNLQARRVTIAARTDSTARRRSDVARRLYLLGRSNVLELNTSITEKDNARRNYINSLSTYWSLYYTLRSLTLFDFQTGRSLEEDIEYRTLEVSD